jgi:hypothetical protein
LKVPMLVHIPNVDLPDCRFGGNNRRGEVLFPVIEEMGQEP